MATGVAGSLREALGAAADALAAAGVQTPRLDAEVLLAEATGRERAALVANPDADVEASQARAFGDMVRRRVRREPVAYIVGSKAFRMIEVAVDRRVLIPRPETEHLVEVALELRPRTVLDVGTGSGALALAIADELPQAVVTGTDVSADALVVASGNAERLGLENRVRFAEGSLPGRDLDRAGGGGVTRFDLVVANLPYVSETEWEGLQPEIRLYEPRGALVAGPTGLEAIEGLLGELAVGALSADAVALEVGAGQAGAVSELVRRSGYGKVEVRQDLAGIDRVVIGS